MAMQDRPICFNCDKSVETNAEMIFEAPCGHDDHSSAVFHPLCLMEWRDRRDQYRAFIKELRDRWMGERKEKEEESG